MKLFENTNYTQLTDELVKGMHIHFSPSSLKRSLGSNPTTTLPANETMPELIFKKEFDLDCKFLGYSVHALQSELTRFILMGMSVPTPVDPDQPEEPETPEVLVMTEDEIREALLSSGKVILDSDITIAAPITAPIDTDSTLELNDHVIANEESLYDTKAGNWSLVSVNGGKLTISGLGSVVALEDDCYAVDVKDGGELIIEGGEFVGNISAVYVHTGIAYIKGGIFKVQQKSDFDDDRYLLNCLDKNYETGAASIIVTGGKFYGFNPADCLAEGEGTNFVAEGYEVVESEEDGLMVYTVQKIEE